MCIASGVAAMKSKTRLGSWRKKLTGSGFSEWIRSGNLIASRMKNTGRLLPTWSQLPSSVRNLTANLECHPARVAGHLGGLPPARHRREADADRGALALLLEQLCPRVLRRRLVTDATVGLEEPVRHGAARVDDALGNALAVEVADLLEELVVLQRGRAARPDGALALVVGDGMSLARCQRSAALAHGALLDGPCVLTTILGLGERIGKRSTATPYRPNALIASVGRGSGAAIRPGRSSSAWSAGPCGAAGSGPPPTPS